MVVALLHLPLLLLKHDDSKIALEQEHKTLGAVPSEGTPGNERLWQIILLTEPSQWFYPTKDGFSRFNRKDPLPEPVLPPFEFRRILLPQTVFEESHLICGELPADDGDFLKLPIFTNTPPKEEKAVPMMLSRWRRVGGGTLLPESAPQIPQEVIETLKSQGSEKMSGLFSPTRIEVQYRPGFSMPRLLLRDTCGNPDLDQCALNALRKALHENGADLKTYSRLTDCLLEVDWLL